MLPATIDARTRVLGLIGYPVRNSLSPLLHNAASRFLGLNCVYVVFEVKRPHLRDAVRGLRALGIAGVNVTVPYKEEVLAYLDGLSEEARAIGSVNTVANVDGKLIGYNTDGRGFLRAFREEAFDPQGRKFLVLGAGGAARAVVFSLLSAGAARIAVSNRTPERASLLVDHFERLFPGRLEVAGFDQAALLSCAEECDAVINATSVGHGGEPVEEVSFEFLPPGKVAFDLIYHPGSPFQRAGWRRGAKVVTGLSMLVFQAAEAFKIWTGQDPPVQVMRTVVEKFVQGE